MTVIVDINEDAIAEDPQLHTFMEQMGDDLAEEAQSHTRVTLHAGRGEVEIIDGVPVLPVGARAAGAIPAEVGTKYRPARQMFKRTADAAELSIADG